MLELPVVPRVDVDIDFVNRFQREGDYTEIVFNLLREVAGEVSVVASIMGEEPTWNRNSAIIGGLMVRLLKLLRSMLSQASRHEGEIVMITGRLAFETIVNVIYLVEKHDEALFDDFVRYSLRTERKLRDRIRREIDARGGEWLPIERRMMDSLERAATNSGVDLDEIQLGNNRGWGNTNIRERAVSIEAGPVYDTLFTIASHAVHGNWQDLLSNNLTVADGRFEPRLDWRGVRPQMLLSISVLSLHAVISAAEFLGGSDSFDAFEKRTDDLRSRITTVNDAHEAFLAV